MENIQDLVRVGVYQVGVPLITIFGILGNILSIIILSQPQFSECLYLYLRGLAVADLGYLLIAVQVSIFFSSDPASNQSFIATRPLAVYVWKCLNPLWNAFIGASDLIVVFMTLNRLIALINIRKVDVGNLELKKRIAFLNIILAFVFSFAVSAPLYFQFDISDFSLCTNLHNDSSVQAINNFPLFPVCPHYRNKVDSREDFIDYYIYFYELIMKILPSITIISLNIIIMKKLSKIWSKRKLVTVPALSSSDSFSNPSTISYLILQPSVVVVDSKVFKHFASLKQKLKPKKKNKRIISLPFIGTIFYLTLLENLDKLGSSWAKLSCQLGFGCTVINIFAVY